MFHMYAYIGVVWAYMECLERILCSGPEHLRLTYCSSQHRHALCEAVLRSTPPLVGDWLLADASTLALFAKEGLWEVLQGGKPLGEGERR